MFEKIIQFFKRDKSKDKTNSNSKDAAKERLHLVLMQDRANVSADFLDLMRQEIIEVIKKYIDVDESAMDVRLTNQTKEDGTQGAPVLYANIPILSVKDENKNIKKEHEQNKDNEKEAKKEVKEEAKKEETKKEVEVKPNEDKKENSKENKVEEKIEESKEAVESKKDEHIKTEEEKEEEQKIEEAIKIVNEETKTEEKTSENDENK